MGFFNANYKNRNEVMDKINYHVLREGDWTLIRKIDDGKKV